MPAIPANQEAKIKRIMTQSQPKKIICKTHHKKGLTEWLKVKALSSSSSTKKKPQKTNIFKKYFSHYKKCLFTEEKKRILEDFREN
jgi:hypothetical protein